MYYIYDFDLYRRKLENEEKQNGNVISTLIWIRPVEHSVWLYQNKLAKKKTFEPRLK